MSKVLPVAIHDRPELNLRQGIKSSLNHWRQLIASAYLFYLYVIDGGDNIYSKEVKTGGKVSLAVSVAFANWLAENWGDIANVTDLVQQCPLYIAQMEHLQVGLQLFLKLSKVCFVNSSFPDAIERTGGNRFNKALYFSTNMKVLAETISAYPDIDRKSFVKGWLSGQDDGKVGNRVKEILAAFTEECQFKIRTQSGELFFQQDGIYDRLRNPHDSVESTDSSEPVGPFRILKSYVKEGMHPYLSEGPNGFVVKSSSEAFTAYADMVQTSLSLIPKRTTIYQEVNQVVNEPPVTLLNVPLQLITYGAPGTGKSDGIERKLRENQIEPIRTTFHPDSDYQSFVGAYKPFMKKIQRVVYVNDGKTAQLVTGPDELKDEEVISYEFRPQSFTEAYVKAWEAMVAGEAKPVVLVIEEINRGDCAKIFGDLFQLLDRDDKTGFSRYPIVADHDLRDYLEKTFGTPAFQACASVEGIDAGVWSDVKVGKKLVLPPNLYIWATMNTSDQSLFPMDSAFKRRWEWKYVPIKNHKDEGWTIDVSGSKKYDWWDFLQKVNKHIFDLTNSEDKQLGYFFVKAKDKVVSLDVFVNKVVFYLWNAVFKDCYTECDFLKDGSSYLIFTKFFDDEGNAKADVVQKFLDALKVDPPKVNENVGTPGGTPQTSNGGQPAVDGESQQSDATVGNEEVQG